MYCPHKSHLKLRHMCLWEDAALGHLPAATHPYQAIHTAVCAAHQVRTEPRALLACGAVLGCALPALLAPAMLWQSREAQPFCVPRCMPLLSCATQHRCVLPLSPVS
jgi:hypothetical protein